MLAVSMMGKPLGPTMPLQPPDYRLVRLPRNGPKPGQSTKAWLYGKNKNCQAERDAAMWRDAAKWKEGQ